MVALPLARLDAAGDVIERYVYASRSHVPDVIVRRDGQRLRLVTDTLGSVRAVVDADTGMVVQRLSYSAYGQVTQDTNPGAQPFGYKGALTDPAAEGAGLIWMGVRAYTPSLARFLTPDPMGLAAAWNQHDALAGDPINLIDPDGQFAVVLIPVAIIGVAAVTSYLETPSGQAALSDTLTICGERLSHGFNNLGNTLNQAFTQQSDDAGVSPAGPGQMSDDQQALKDLVEDATLGGRKPLPREDAETVLDWADETRYPGARAKAGDVANPSNWNANPVPHVHLPGAGRGGHVPVQPGVRPRP